MKRQSTVERLSNRKLQAIVAYMQEHRCGFILRYKGVEYGLKLLGDVSCPCLVVEWTEAYYDGPRWHSLGLDAWLSNARLALSNLMVRKGWASLGGHPHVSGIVDSIMELLGYPPSEPRQVSGELQVCNSYRSEWSVWEGVQ